MHSMGSSNHSKTDILATIRGNIKPVKSKHSDSTVSYAYQNVMQHAHQNIFAD